MAGLDQLRDLASDLWWGLVSALAPTIVLGLLGLFLAAGRNRAPPPREPFPIRPMDSSRASSFVTWSGKGLFRRKDR